jgi:mannose-1-phosphate guanylyltransferase
MAGGSGTRFWPRSREGKSKQFLPILEKNSLIASTIMRFRSLTSHKNIYIVAKKSQEDELLKHSGKIPSENIIYEPFGRNTAPCIGLAAVFIGSKDKEGVMVVSPSDHMIKNKRQFNKVIRVAAELATEKDGIVTIGITPERPATGYGYIQTGAEIVTTDGVKTYSIKTFAEKPNLATAQRFLQSGDFFWNSGIFVFRISVFLKLLKQHMPDLHEGLEKIQKAMDKPNYEDVLNKVYQQLKSVSIDYGVMEKINNVYLVRGNFEWNDLGSWEQVYKLSPKDEDGNVISGDVIAVDTKNSYVYNSKGLVAVLGLKDVIVVHEGGATLVCSRDKAEDVKGIVDRLKRKKLQKYL